jgi:hypothetical protein
VVTSVVKFIDDLALTKLTMWHRNFNNELPGGTFQAPPAVDFLVHPLTWREYRREIMRTRLPLPPDLQIYGTPVLLSDQVGIEDVRLVIV